MDKESPFAFVCEVATPALAWSVEDNDLERFFRYLLRTWEVVQPDILDSTLGTLLSGLAPDNADILDAFINTAEDIAHHTVLVLDDYHTDSRFPARHKRFQFLRCRSRATEQQNDSDPHEPYNESRAKQGTHHV